MNKHVNTRYSEASSFKMFKGFIWPGWYEIQFKALHFIFLWCSGLWESLRRQSQWNQPGWAGLWGPCHQCQVSPNIFGDQTNILNSDIISRCPSLSSARWCYRLYSIILASLGLLLSFLWVSWETNLNKSCPRTFSALVFMVVECLAMQSYPLDQGQWPLFFFVERLTMCKCTS